MSLFKGIKNFSVIGKDVIKNNLDEHGPTIAIYAGTIALIGGGIFLATKTSKATEIIESHKNGMEIINKAKVVASETNQEYTDADIKADTFIVYRDTAFKFGKLYIQPVMIMVIGVASIMWGTNKMNSKIASITAEAVGLLATLNQYRERVKDEVGPDKERDLYFGTTSESETSNLKVDDDTFMEGKVKEVDKKGIKKNPLIVEWGPINEDGTENSEFDSRHPSSNYIVARSIQRNANMIVNACRADETIVIKLDDILKEFGIPMHSRMLNKAWIVSRDNSGNLYSVMPGGSTYIDLGINEDHPELYIDAHDLSEEQAGIADATDIMLAFSGLSNYADYLKMKESKSINLYSPIKNN